jgi:hypothetical protein
MSDKNGDGADAGARAPHRFLGSLKDALMAAARSDSAPPADSHPPLAPITPSPVRVDGAPPPVVNKAAAVDVETVAPPKLPPHTPPRAPEPMPDAQVPNSVTRVIRGSDPRKTPPAGARTQLVRGRVDVARGEFHQDPVVGWLVVVGGAGLGAFRPIFEGNNTIGRARTQRIAIDFGDETISGEEQAYIRYDSADRSFLFVPNLSKTNVVSINNRKPTAAVPLQAMDVITMGRTQLAFVPFCGGDFDWSELMEGK